MSLQPPPPTPPKPMSDRDADAVLGFIMFAILVAVFVAVVVTIATRGEQPYKTYNVGGPVDVGTIEHDGHKFIVTNRFGVTLTHHPDCTCQARNETEVNP